MNQALPEPGYALMRELATAAPGTHSTARLCKRLGVRMSSLLRCLAYLGKDGLGWVQTLEDGERTLLSLTPAGQEQWAQWMQCEGEQSERSEQNEQDEHADAKGTTTATSSPTPPDA